MNVQQAIKILGDYGVTNSEQILRRWIRQGKIKAVMRNKKEGYEIDQFDLMDFIWKRENNNKKGYTDFIEQFTENRKLKKRIDELEKAKEKLEQDLLDARWKNIHYITDSNIKPFSNNEKDTKKIFRSILSKLHPDNGGHEESFKKVNELYRNVFKK